MKQQIEQGDSLALCQRWEESELRWGVRPDGFSLHVSMVGLRQFIKQYWDTMPDTVPSEYSRPVGIPYPVKVAESLFKAVEASNDGLRFYANYATPDPVSID